MCGFVFWGFFSVSFFKAIPSWEPHSKLNTSQIKFVTRPPPSRVSSHPVLAHSIAAFPRHSNLVSFLCATLTPAQEGPRPPSEVTLPPRLHVRPSRPGGCLGSEPHRLPCRRRSWPRTGPLGPCHPPPLPRLTIIYPLLGKNHPSKNRDLLYFKAPDPV